jgi:hypothetical protein
MQATLVTDYGALNYIDIGRDSSVGIANHYGWTARESNPGEGRGSSHPSRSVLGPSQPFVQWVQCLFPEGKTAGT